jgi:diguanylate cyclase (GGDEF)-like protein/PAS domain S-box-containing protein
VPTAQPAMPWDGGEERQRRWFQALVQRSTDVAMVLGDDNVLRFVSSAVAPMLGWDAEQLVGKDGFTLIHPDDVPLGRERHADALAHPGPQGPFELRLLRADGSSCWVEVRMTNLLDDPDVAGLVINFRDIEDRRRVEEALRSSGARYRAIVETAQEGIWLIRDDGRTLFANEKFAQILGRPLAEVYDLPAPDVVPEQARDTVLPRLQSRPKRGHETYELQVVRPDGELRTILISASPLVEPGGGYVGSLAMITDITARKQAEDQLRRRALYDELTGLPNRALLADRLQTALAQRDAADELTVLFFDLDGFKLVNDTYGHDAGDRLLVLVADRLRNLMRAGDTLSRLAGDEFVAVCPGLRPPAARALADRALSALGRPFDLGDTQVQVSASVGIAHATGPQNLDNLVAAADTAMLEAKRERRGGVVTFDAALAARPRDRLRRIQDLRRAIEAGELVVHYQPQVQLSSGRVVAAEALARWQHPDRGLLHPADFIPLAEQSGLIVDLGRIVLERACVQAALWQPSGPLPVAVNISARQLADDQLLDHVADALAKSGLPPCLLRLELTETSIMDDVGRAVRVLGQLRDLGVELSIDDFGTGYSSLACLTQLPLDELKIDRAFIDGVQNQGRDREVVKAIIAMARALELRVIAEGVETATQAESVRALGCAVAQGFLFAHAVAAPGAWSQA